MALKFTMWVWQIQFSHRVSLYSSPCKVKLYPSEKFLSFRAGMVGGWGSFKSSLFIWQAKIYNSSRYRLSSNVYSNNRKKWLWKTYSPENIRSLTNSWPNVQWKENLPEIKININSHYPIFNINKAGIKVVNFNIIKAINDKPTTSIILKGRKPFFQDQEQDKDAYSYCFYST